MNLNKFIKKGFQFTLKFSRKLKKLIKKIIQNLKFDFNQNNSEEKNSNELSFA